ncbi:MAG TPA: prepilin-type N-terminal cleavage/methylation domain-containing protein [Candidatus Paceibacterota bacterium]|nr:prepilin-type N-terminal cleavage/methylation domain-containing protein [Candidatus Paceibacterota bacterium]
MSIPNKNNRGFTLIEVLVSLAILTIAIIPALYLSNSAANVGFAVRDNFIAAGLAQEGIEVVRAIRDTNWFNGRAFDSGLADGSYRLEWNSTSLLALGANPPLNIDDGLYTYDSGTPSVFSRSITITKVNSGELKVVSTVTWQTRTNDTKTVSAEDHLFDWK